MRRKRFENIFSQDTEWLESPDHGGLVLPSRRLFSPKLSKSAPCKCCPSATTTNFTLTLTKCGGFGGFLSGATVLLKQGGVTKYSGTTNTGGSVNWPSVVSGVYQIICSVGTSLDFTYNITGATSSLLLNGQVYLTGQCTGRTNSNAQCDIFGATWSLQDTTTGITYGPYYSTSSVNATMYIGAAGDSYTVTCTMTNPATLVSHFTLINALNPSPITLTATGCNACTTPTPNICIGGLVSVKATVSGSYVYVEQGSVAASTLNISLSGTKTGSGTLTWAGPGNGTWTGSVGADGFTLTPTCVGTGSTLTWTGNVVNNSTPHNMPFAGSYTFAGPFTAAVS